MSSLHLPSFLLPDDRHDIARPVPYRGRLGLRLPEEHNQLQKELDSLRMYAEQHLMSINHKKSKILVFTRHRKYDFIPEYFGVYCELMSSRPPARVEGRS